MPQFESQSTRKLSIAPIVAPKQTRVTIGDDITNLIKAGASVATTVARQQEDTKTKEDLAIYQQHAQLYTATKRKYIDDSRNAVTADDKKRVFTEYANTLDTITNSSQLSDKYKIQLQTAANRDLSFASADYEGTLKAEQKSMFHSAAADVVSAMIGADRDTKYTTYKSFLDASSAYMLTKSEAAEMFSKSLVDATTVNLLQENTTYSQAKEASDDVLKVLSNDMFSAGKSYITKATIALNEVQTKIASKYKNELVAFIGSEQYSLSEKEAKIKESVSDGWLNDKAANVMTEGIRSDAFTKERSGIRLLQDAELLNFTIPEERAKDIAFNPKAGLSKEAQQAKFTGWKANRDNLNRQLNIANMKNFINNDLVPPKTKIPILEKAIEVATTEMEKANLSALLVSVKNTQTTDTIKSYESIIKNKAASFEEAYFAVKELQAKGFYDENKANKVVSDLLIKEEKRVVKKVEIDNKDIEGELKKGNKEVLSAVLKNPEYPLAYKIKKVEETNVFVEERKKEIIANLKENSLKESAKLSKNMEKEERIAYKNITTNYSVAADNGDMTINTKEWSNSIVLGWVGEKIPEGVWGSYVKYTKQQDLYNAWKAGVPISNPESYANIYLKNIPEIESKLSSIMNVDNMTPDLLQSSIKTVDIAKANRYIVKKEVEDAARIARILMQFSPATGTERYKTYLTTPHPKPSQGQKESYYNMIMGATGIDSLKIGKSMLNDVIDIVINTSMNSQESKQYIKQVMEDNFIAVDNILSEDFLVPKGTDYMRDETALSTSNKVIGKKIGYDIKTVIPIDFSNMGTTDWIAIPNDSSKEPIHVTNEYMRLIGSTK